MTSNGLIPDIFRLEAEWLPYGRNENKKAGVL